MQLIYLVAQQGMYDLHVVNIMYLYCGPAMCVLLHVVNVMHLSFDPAVHVGPVIRV